MPTTESQTGGGGGFDAVAVLDADPGQPELSPTGMLTLTVLRGPLLQQPYHHMVAGATSSGSSTYDDDSDNDDMDHDQETLSTSTSMRHQHGSGCYKHGNRNEQAFFFGSNTSQSDPVRYLECVAALLQSYENLVEKEKSFGNSSSSIPLIVNLDGWVKGFGEQILQAMLGQHIRPNHILQIVGDLKSKMFDLSAQVSDPTVLHVAYAYNSVQDKFVGHEDDCDESTTPITNSVSYYGPSDGAGASGTRVAKRVPVQSFSISAANLRAQRLATYFCGARMWDSVGFGQNGIDDPACKIANHVAAVKPYIVPWEAVDWQHFALPDTCGDIVSPNMILAALNGSVVGLCRRQSGDSTNSENHLLSCVGLGLIRAIDHVRQLFFIITPVAPEQLASVNVLSRGIISVPLEFYFRGVRSEGFPYQACDDSAQVDVLGGDPMKSRNSIARKGGGN
jgi:polynucleotide 5'-hydroxyl-kinase GRC3/NOL9